MDFQKQANDLELTRLRLINAQIDLEIEYRRVELEILKQSLSQKPEQ